MKRKSKYKLKVSKYQVNQLRKLDNDTREELDATLFHAIKLKAPKVAENMEFIKTEIKKYEDSHKDVQLLCVFINAKKR